MKDVRQRLSGFRGRGWLAVVGGRAGSSSGLSGLVVGLGCVVLKKWAAWRAFECEKCVFPACSSFWRRWFSVAVRGWQGWCLVR